MSADGTDGEPTVQFATALNVLLVDDDEQWARATARLLEAAEDGFTVTVAHSLEAGRNRFENDADDVDCVVCDYQLGDGTGLSLLETVRETDSDKPFILLTGRGDEAVASEAIGRGVTDYIPKRHDDDESTLLATRLKAAVDAYRTRRRLDRERRGKAATLEVLTSTTEMDELAAQFCRVLVEEQGYAGAWIGSIDDGLVVPRAVTGCEAYLDAVLTGDSTAEIEEPAVAALDRDELVVVSPVEEPELEAEAWHRLGQQYGFGSAAGLPISHDGVRVGVLGVYGPVDGPNVCESERGWQLLEEYATIIGHAHRTAEWKRSLLSDRSVRIDVEIVDDRAPLVDLATAFDSEVQITVPSIIDHGDEVIYLAQFANLQPIDIRTAIEQCASMEYHELTRHGEIVRGDLHSKGPTPEGLLATQGAQIQQTTVSDGVATISATVSDHEAINSLVGRLETEYEEVNISTLWNDTTSRTPEPSASLLESLTDRQHDVLRHAYFDGYFEHPRGVSATELAEKFDLARATLSQHLRTGQEKVFAQLFDPPD